MARIGFVGNFAIDRAEWLVNTGKKILDTGNDLAIEMNQSHEYLYRLDRQLKSKKEVEQALSSFTQDITFSLHVPWKPYRYYNLLQPDSDVSFILKWMRFAANIGVSTVNVHMASDEGATILDWPKVMEKGKKHYLDIVGNNLRPVVAEAEKLGLKLTLENLMPNTFVEETGQYKIFYVGNFPEDFEYVQKKFGYKFGVTPDTCHLVMTWLGLNKSTDYGLWPEDEHWKKYELLTNFLSAWLKGVKTIYEVHISDCAGLKYPSEHGIVLGEGLLTGHALRTVLNTMPKGAIRMLELKEAWDAPEEIEKLGYLPKTVKSLGKLVDATINKI